MLRIELSDGRWVELSRLMYISDKQKVVDLEAAPGMLERARQLERMRGYLAILEPALGGTSWNGPLADMTEDQLLTLLAEWSFTTTETAVPKASGSPSVTTSLPGNSPSPAPRKSRSRSETRPSG